MKRQLYIFYKNIFTQQMKAHVLQWKMIETALNIHAHDSAYKIHNRFMVSWWGRYQYFNNKQIQIGDVVPINTVYGSSGSFRSRVGSKYIGNNTYTGNRSNSFSKPTPIHVPVNQSELIFSYLRSQFSWLPQAVSRGLIDHLSQ